MERAKLAEARYSEGWSQEEVAEKVGVSRNTVSLWERGLLQPYPIHVHGLCQLFGKKAEELDLGQRPKEPANNKSTKSLAGPVTSPISSSALEGPGNTSPETQSFELISTLIDPSGIDGETLDLFEQLTVICWRLSKGSDLAIAEQILWSYLPKLVSHALPPSPRQKRLAAITSECYLLAASLAGHHNDLRARQYFSEQALLYGNVAQDRNLQVSALTQLALTFDYQQCPGKALQAYQSTLPYLREVAPLLRARVYISLSDTCAQSGMKQEALHFLSLAYENFPETPETNINLLYADCEYPTLLLWAGLTHLDLGQFDKAANIFEQVDGLQPKIKIAEKVRIAFLNYQAETLIAQGNMEQACKYLEAAVKASLTLGSKRRHNEALTIFTQIQNTWNDEQRVKDLEDLFRT